MEIGELLKEYRIELGLTQKQMAAGIVTPSYYSKVEKGEHRISAYDLFLILERNHIQPSDFIVKYQDNDRRILFEEFNDAIIYAFYEENIEYLDILKAKINDDQFLSIGDKEILLALIETTEATNNNDIDSLGDETKEFLRKKFFLLEDWTDFKLTLYANILSIYSIESNHAIISSITKQDLSHFVAEQQVTVISILLNFINQCIITNNDQLAIYYNKKIEVISTIPMNMFQKLLSKYYALLLSYRNGPSEELLGEIENVYIAFELAGLRSLHRKLQIYTDEHKNK